MATKKKAPRKTAPKKAPPELTPVLVDQTIAALRILWEETHEAIGGALADARLERVPLGMLRALEHRVQTSTSVGRDILVLERARDERRKPLDYLAAAAKVLADAVGRLEGLEHGAPLYEDDAHDIVGRL